MCWPSHRWDSIRANALPLRAARGMRICGTGELQFRWLDDQRITAVGRPKQQTITYSRRRYRFALSMTDAELHHVLLIRCRDSEPDNHHVAQRIPFRARRSLPQQADTRFADHADGARCRSKSHCVLVFQLRGPGIATNRETIATAGAPMAKPQTGAEESRAEPS